MSPKRSPDISKSSTYPWSIPVLHRRKASRGTEALAHLFYVVFWGSPRPCHGSGSQFLSHSVWSHPKPHFAGDTEQAPYMHSLHTWLLITTLLVINYHPPESNVLWQVNAQAWAPVPSLTLELHPDFWHPLCPPRKLGSSGAGLNLYFPCLCRCTVKEQDTGASGPQACDQIISPSVTHPNHHSWRPCQQY